MTDDQKAANEALATRIVAGFGDLFAPLIEAAVADALEGRGDIVATLTVERGDTTTTHCYVTRPVTVAADPSEIPTFDPTSPPTPSAPIRVEWSHG